MAGIKEVDDSGPPAPSCNHCCTPSLTPIDMRSVLVSNARKRPVVREVELETIVGIA
jgi:hypothetical protein